MEIVGADSLRNFSETPHSEENKPLFDVLIIMLKIALERDIILAATPRSQQNLRWFLPAEDSGRERLKGVIGTAIGAHYIQPQFVSSEHWDRHLFLPNIQGVIQPSGGERQIVLRNTLFGESPFDHNVLPNDVGLVIFQGDQVLTSQKGVKRELTTTERELLLKILQIGKLRTENILKLEKGEQYDREVLKLGTPNSIFRDRTWPPKVPPKGIYLEYIGEVEKFLEARKPKPPIWRGIEGLLRGKKQ